MREAVTHRMSDALKKWLVDNCGVAANAADADHYKALTKALANRRITVEKVAELIDDKTAFERTRERFESLVRAAVEKTLSENPRQGRRSTIMPQINVLPEAGKYKTDTTYIKHAKTGELVRINSRPVEAPTELTMAKAGVWLKHSLRRQAGIADPLPEHEHTLLKEMVHTGMWAGGSADSDEGWSDGRALKEWEKATFLNDITSGGQYLVGPAEWDEALVTYPLLYGELFPLVDIRQASNHQVTTQTVKNPTAKWNEAVDEGSPTAFDFTSFVGQLTPATTHRPISCFMLMGLDFLADAAVNVAQTMQGLLGPVLQKELDKVVAVGDGTTQPLGIFTSTGTTAVTSVMGTGGPPLLADLESLYFALPKQYRVPSMRPVFAMADTTYAHFRSVPYGSLDDRRLLGEIYSSYQLLDGLPARIQNDIVTNQAAFCAMSRYRMWRRVGFETKLTTEGKTLTMANEALLSVRGRYGGRPIDPAAFAVMSDLSLTY